MSQICFNANDYLPYNGICHINDNISVISTEITGFVDLLYLPCTVYVYSDDKFIGGVNLNDNQNFSLQIPNSFCNYLQENEKITAKIGKGKFNFSNSSNVVNVNGILHNFYEPKVFKNTNYSKIIDYNNPYILEWSQNITDKFINGDILNNYISKTDDLSVFFEIISTFFAISVTYAKEITDIAEPNEFLKRYLAERNIVIPSKYNLELASVVSQNFIKIIRERSTLKTIQNPQDSEHKNFIAPYLYQDYVYDIIDNKYLGFNIENSSPLFGGNISQNKFLKNFISFDENINNISFSNKNNVTVSSSNIVLGNNSGIGSLDDFKPIIVDQNKSYIFNFKINKNSGNDLSIGFYCFDILGNKLQLRSSKDNTLISDYFSNDFDTIKNDEFINIECIIYGSLTKPFTKKLQTFFKNQDSNLSNFILPFRTQFIIPFVYYKGNGACIIKNLNFSQLFREPYSFIQKNNIVDLSVESSIIFNKDEKINHYEKHFIPYSYNVFINNSFKLEENFINLTTDCYCVQEPVFIETGESKCIGRNLYKEYKDINTCTKYQNKWEIVNSSTSCTDCPQINTFSHEIIEERDSSNPFSYQNKFYRKKVSQYFNDGNCNYVITINYYDQVNTPCVNTNPIWIQEDSTIYCEITNCPQGSQPVYVKEGDPVCYTWYPINPVDLWDILEENCIENDGIYNPVQEDWQFIEEACYEELPDCDFIEFNQIKITC